MDPRLEAWGMWLRGLTRDVPPVLSHWTGEGTFTVEPETIAGTRIARLYFAGRHVGDSTHIAWTTSVAREPAKRREFNLPEAPESLLDWNGFR